MHGSQVYSSPPEPFATIHRLLALPVVHVNEWRQAANAVLVWADGILPEAPAAGATLLEKRLVDAVMEAFVLGEDESANCERPASHNTFLWCYWNSADDLCSECAAIKERVEQSIREVLNSAAPPEGVNDETPREKEKRE